MQFKEFEIKDFDINKKWIIFGIKMCHACFEAKKQFEAKGYRFKYYDVKTKEGMAQLAYYGLVEIAEKQGLPIVIEDK